MSLCEAANGPTALALIVSDLLFTITTKESGVEFLMRPWLDSYPVEGPIEEGVYETERLNCHAKPS